MKKTNVFDLFPVEYRDLILHYKKVLTRIFEEYQAVIFMARKAICFYKSLNIAGFIKKPKNCEIYSGRILTYNIKERLAGKKVIVIDDVMIRGNSIEESIRILQSYNINADVYIMACREGNDILNNFNIIDTFAELTEEDTLRFSECIANFIEANMCPYNIDQPIYSFDGFDDDTMYEFIAEQNLVDISSSSQNKHGIKSYVLKIPNNCIHNSMVKSHVDLCKIRFLYGTYDSKSVFLAIPFVLLGEMTTDELDILFSYYENNELTEFISNENEGIIYENKLKILHYILAAELMREFADLKKIGRLHRLNGNDAYVFSQDVLEVLRTNTKSFDFSEIALRNDTSYNNEFKMNEYLGITFDFLYSDNMNHMNYYDSQNNCITSELLIISQLKEYMSIRLRTEVDEMMFSNVIDVLIDKGLIIPSIIHGKNSTIIRAYKCGEVYALNKEHFRLFTYALGEYLKNIKHDKLQKTEFEKLCVLFFREAMHKGILSYGESKGEEDEYSICYSKFGPRVSTSKPIYSADETSTLASRLLNLNMIEIITIESRETKEEGETDSEKHADSFNQISYYIPAKIDKDEIKHPNWQDVAQVFARRYESIYDSLFNENNGIHIFDNVRNMYIRNYTELLTMLAIGTSRKNQLLSLLAELYLLDSIETDTDVSSILIQCNRILDGLISGMWKYMCYSQSEHPLKKIRENLYADKTMKHISIFLGDAMNVEQDTDKNKNIESLIHEAGKLLFSLVYSIWFMSKKYNIICSIRGEYLDIPEKRKREFYFRKMTDLRKSIEDQIEHNDRIQDIAQIDSLKKSAEQILNKYAIEISNGKRQNKSEQSVTFNAPVQNLAIYDKEINKFMNIKINGNIENFTNFGKDGTQINIYGATEYKNLYDALEKLKAEANDDEKKEILNAQDGINEKDDNKVITALKKLTPFIEKVSSSVISTAITAYMKAHGLIP